MGLFNLTARQHRFLAKLNGNINKTTILSHGELQEIIPEARIKDGMYICPDNGMVSEILSKQPHCNRWMGTRFSFDKCVQYSQDAAILMRGYAFGIMDCKLYTGEFHRMNIFVNRHGKVWAFEPQLCTYPGDVIAKQGAIHIGAGWENPYGNIDEEMESEMVVPNRG